jgi:DHA1 family inner membrane transport protein
MSRKEKIILLLLALLNFTHILDFMIMMPLGNYLIPYFHISSQKFSAIVSAYSYSAFASGIIASFFVDNHDRKKILLFGYVGFLTGTILCGFAPSANLLIAARIVAGLFGGLIGAQVLSIVADTFVYEKRGQAMGYLMSAFSVASVVGIPFGLFLANKFSWHAPFLFIGIVGIALIPFLVRYIPAMTLHLADNAADKKTKWQTFEKIFLNLHYRIALALSGFLMLGHFLLVPFLTPFMEFNVGFSKNQIQYIYIVGGIITLISAPISGKIADNVGKLKVYIWSAILSLIPVFLITNMPAIVFYYVLVVTGFWFLVSNARAISAATMVSNAVPPQLRGSFMSFNSSMQQLCIAIASTLTGFIIVSDSATHKIKHYNWAGYLSISILIFCIYLGIKVAKKQPPSY